MHWIDTSVRTGELPAECPLILDLYRESGLQRAGTSPHQPPAIAQANYHVAAGMYRTKSLKPSASAYVNAHWQNCWPSLLGTMLYDPILSCCCCCVCFFGGGTMSYHEAQSWAGEKFANVFSDALCALNDANRSTAARS